jgi:hypothetical protein
MSTHETATYLLGIMCEKTSLFQPDESLSHKISVPVEKKQDFDSRPGGVPDVDKLQPKVHREH